MSIALVHSMASAKEPPLSQQKNITSHGSTLAHLMRLTIADGQMEYPLQGIDDAKAEIAASNRNNLRLFSAPDNR